MNRFSRETWERDYDRIVEVAEWISPATRTWIEHHSRVPGMLGTARDDGETLF